MSDIIKVFRRFKYDILEQGIEARTNAVKTIEDILITQVELTNKTLRNVEEELLYHRRGRKTTLLQVWFEFCNTLYEYKITYKTSLTDTYIASNRRIEMLKVLHEPKRNRDLVEEFGISERTLQNDRNLLKKGIDFFGYKVKIHEMRPKPYHIQSADEKQKYISTAHPFALILNLTEVHTMTIVMLDYLKDTNKLLYDSYVKIASIVYSQLSDYAKKIIDQANVNGHQFIKKNYLLKMN